MVIDIRPRRSPQPRHFPAVLFLYLPLRPRQRSRTNPWRCSLGQRKHAYKSQRKGHNISYPLDGSCSSFPAPAIFTRREAFFLSPRYVPQLTRSLPLSLERSSTIRSINAAPSEFPRKRYFVRRRVIPRMLPLSPPKVRRRSSPSNGNCSRGERRRRVRFAGIFFLQRSPGSE